MQLKKNDVDLFYKLYGSLLVYANKKSGISERINKMEGLDNESRLCKLSADELQKIRNYIYDHPEIIDSYVEENPENFSEEEIAIVKGWKNFIRDNFYIMEFLKEYTTFYDESNKIVYGVLGLNSPIESIVPYIPCLAKGILLPFKGCITYDGILEVYNVHFGAGMRKRLMMEYNETKAKFGLVTSLPLPKERKENYENLLKFYLKTKETREWFYEEIDDLLTTNKELLPIYYQEMGKHNAIKHSKKLKEFMANNKIMWFAIIDDVIVACGKTREDVEKNLNEIIPNEKRGFAYIFKVSKK